MVNQLGPSTVDAIAVLAQRDWTQRRIATELGINRGTVGRYIQLWGDRVPCEPENGKNDCGTTNKTAKRGHSPIRELVQARLNSGATIKAIHRELITAHDFHGSYSSVRRIARQLKRNPSAALKETWPG